jgi:hypothetical protein
LVTLHFQKIAGDSTHSEIQISKKIEDDIEFKDENGAVIKPIIIRNEETLDMEQNVEVPIKPILISDEPYSNSNREILQKIYKKGFSIPESDVTETQIAQVLASADITFTKEEIKEILKNIKIE